MYTVSCWASNLTCSENTVCAHQMATAVIWKVGFACLVVVAVAVAAAPSSVSVHASEDQVAEMTVDAEGGARRELGARGGEACAGDSQGCRYKPQ